MIPSFASIRGLWRIVVVALIVTQSAHTQPAALQFEHFTIRDGLSQDIVTTLFRDHLGFLWIGTEDGLNRYDGYSIVGYKHNSRDTNALIHNHVTGICGYGEEDLLVTTDLGINIYRRASNVFTRPGGNLAPYAAMGTAKPVRDKRGRYWMILRSRNVLRYDPIRDSVSIFDPFSGAGAFTNDLIVDLTIDSEDSIWVISEKNISVFLGDDKGFSTYPLRYERADVVNSTAIKDPHGQIWIATKGGLYRYDREQAIPK